MTIVQTNQISKTYRSGVFKRSNIVALKEVSLEVNAGEIFGLLGPNGAGKTTFVKLLLSIVRPTSGEGLVLDQPLGTTAVREKCGYLPENHRYPNFLSGRDTLICFGRLHGMNNRILRDKAESLLHLVGLKDWAKVKIKKYSKGMLQRLGLAQALLNDPPVLFLDEPTDGVDPIGRKEIRDILATLRNQGTTVFLNSHLLSEVEATCDRVAILNKGEVLRVGTVAELTLHELSYEIQLDSRVPDDLLAKLTRSVGNVEKTENSLIARVKDKAELNRIIDEIRSAGISIASVAQQKSTLEDSFIKLVKEDDQ